MTSMLKHALELWASVFSNHAALRTGIDFLHVGGLLGGGGAAIVADRMALRAGGHSEGMGADLESFESTHRVVLVGLGIVMTSGLLLLGSDVDTFLHSKIFWLKMTLLALLLPNGAQLVRAERAARRGDARAVRRLRVLAGASLALWFLITLAGTALTNI
jgi:hypothetical protein